MGAFFTIGAPVGGQNSRFSKNWKWQKKGNFRASFGQFPATFDKKYIILALLACPKYQLSTMKNGGSFYIFLLQSFKNLLFFKNSTFSKKMSNLSFLSKSWPWKPKLLKIWHFMKYLVRWRLNKHKLFFYIFFVVSGNPLGGVPQHA